MEFCAGGRPLTQAGFDRACTALAIAGPVIWAVLVVETRGFGFLSDRRPAILFERHMFRRLTDGHFDAARPDLSDATPGGYLGGRAEYDRLTAAILLDRQSALQSTSWGIGQVMGFNFRSAGFASVGAFTAQLATDEDSQLAAIATLMKNNGWDAALRRRDWKAFAAQYNGNDFRRNSYDERLAAACAACESAVPDLDFRTMQAALLYLGFAPGPVDGLPGPRTREAIRAFQAHNGLSPTGAASSATQQLIMTKAFPA